MNLLHSLQWRIVLSYTVLIIVSMGAVSIYLVNFVRDTYISGLEERLEREAVLAAESLAPFLDGGLDLDGLRETGERVGGLIEARVTVMDRDGEVLADTWERPDQLQNQAQRPEVREALAGDISWSTRVSAAQGEELLYTAAPIQADGELVGVARVAIPTSAIHSNVSRIITTIAISAVVVSVLSLALGYYLARRTARSVRSVTEAARQVALGDLEHRVEALAADETRELADAFNSMASSLRSMVQELSGERDKLSAVLDTMADGVALIGPEERTELVNIAGLEMLGVREPQPLGMRFPEVVRDSDLNRLVATCLKTGEQQHGEVELFQPVRFLSAIATPIVEAEATWVLLTIHDLTRMHQVETTRREFVTNVSHELRSPLASVKAIVETLDNGALDEAEVARDFVRRINWEVDRMSRMVEDLLDLARLDSRQGLLSLNTVDLRLLMTEVKESFQERADNKNVRVEVIAPERLPRAVGDEERLRQVLINLLDNALKFTPGTGWVTLSAYPEEDMVRVGVRDSGAGIPEDHLPHIFERFYKADRSRQGGGTGLGLAIVKHIVQAHGSEVAVQSREGEGSAFTFTLPRAT
ncbi:MAG: ATP-binding protein [Chloroflexota bacterium]|nr:ATP-binding protein [Chloroflexota bacterium]MDE2942166.1 ATP-binding protein [Chloroflexota bacterium]MDE3268002.1 ATP-binding protein [Chloroflexota bacterium]